MRTRISGVYAIAHQPSGRVYVGSSYDIVRRWQGHISRLSSGTHHTPALCELWLLDGPTAFLFVVLEQCAREDLAIREQLWMDSFEQPLNKSRTARHCPTLDPVIAAKAGATHRGRHHSPESRARISATLMGHPVSEEARANMRVAVRTLSVISPETRAKMLASRRANGWVVSEETRARMRAGHARRKPASPEYRARLSLSAHKGWQKRRMGGHL